MTIQEQNRIIANFMGGEVREVVRINDKVTMAWCGHIAKQWRKEKLGINVGDAILENQLEFHSDWNWLMPAWIKFRNLNLDSKEYSEWCSSLGWYLYSSDEPSRFCERLAFAIKWYNTLKK